MPKNTVIRRSSSSGYKADEHTVEFDSGTLAYDLAQAVAEAHRQAIRSGQEANGGSQRPLRDPRSDAGPRGVGTEGRFVGSITTSQRPRNELRASVEIGADPYFDPWLEREANRGVEYFFVDGEVDYLVDTMISESLDEALR